MLMPRDGAGDQLVPGGVGPDAGGGDILLGAGLDQGVVAHRAVGVHAAAADPDPVGGRARMARVPADRGDRPIARDRVELLAAALLQAALVVAEPVAALICVHAKSGLEDVNDVAVGARKRRCLRGEAGAEGEAGSGHRPVRGTTFSGGTSRPCDYSCGGSGGPRSTGDD